MKPAFHVVYTLLALNFWIPVAIYVFAPDTAIAQFVAIGEPFGAGPYPHTEDSMFWRVLGIANVATLGFCCVLLQVDVRKFFPVLFPLVFLKGSATLGWFVAWLVEGQPQYLVAALFDAATVAAMWIFASGARRVADAPALSPATA